MLMDIFFVIDFVEKFNSFIYQLYNRFQRFYRELQVFLFEPISIFTPLLVCSLALFRAYQQPKLVMHTMSSIFQNKSQNDFDDAFFTSGCWYALHSPRATYQQRHK